MRFCQSDALPAKSNGYHPTAIFNPENFQCISCSWLVHFSRKLQTAFPFERGNWQVLYSGKSVCFQERTFNCFVWIDPVCPIDAQISPLHWHAKEVKGKAPFSGKQSGETWRKTERVEISKLSQTVFVLWTSLTSWLHCWTWFIWAVIFFLFLDFTGCRSDFVISGWNCKCVNRAPGAEEINFMLYPLRLCFISSRKWKLKIPRRNSIFVSDSRFQADSNSPHKEWCGESRLVHHFSK